MLVQAADREEAMSGLIKSENDLFLNGALPYLLIGPSVECMFKASENYPICTMEAPSPGLKEALQVCTGWQAIPRPPDNGFTVSTP